MNTKVFISYRREDTAPYAGRLYDRLTAHFGEGQIFIDIGQIEAGEDFVEVINRKLASCDTAIVLIGPNWLRATDPSGKRRLDDEEDFVRREIVAVLQRKIRVIPTLVGGARMPRKQDLPEALAPLSRRNAIELSETRFHADVNQLIEAIEKPFEETAELSATPEKSTRSTLATPPVQSTSSIAALKEPKIWTSKRWILVSAIVLLFLFVLAGFLLWPRHEAQFFDQRDPAILNILGTRYEKGDGVPKNLGKAAELYKKAADQGHADAQCNLALLYQNGEGVRKDLRKAVELFQKAAALGYARGQFDVGLLYYAGEGVPKDLAAAAQLFQKAADQGEAQAQYNLGLLYQNGEGVPKDLAKAVELLQKAANQGFEQASIRLGVLANEAQVESLRNFELAFIDEFAVSGKPYNAAAFDAKVNEGNAKFQKAIADDKFPMHRPVLVDLKKQFDADVGHLRFKNSRGRVSPALATEMKKGVNTIYDHALGR
jgi:TPR repeat protein